MKQIGKFNDWLFRRIHTNNLIYNTCWEDPRCDRQLLQLQNDSEVVMITSAGCNALDYLLDEPSKINCIDMNPRQNALLELKKTALKHLSYDNFFQLFGEGKHPEIKTLFKEQLAPNLPAYAKEYWSKNLNFFSTKGVRKSFYHYSTSGTIAWIAKQYFRTSKTLNAEIKNLFDTKTLEEQASCYEKIESKAFNKRVKAVVNRKFMMYLVGVPESQQKLFVEEYELGALGFIKECLHKVFAERPLHDNYFWRVYLFGSYTQECSPNYVKEGNFDFYKQNVDRVQTHTTTIADFLKKNPKAYSHYILLDHQDWLAANNIDALNEEWELILKNSKPGTRILLRSAAKEVDFFPDFVKEKLEFEQVLTSKTHEEDRVGTYASVYLGIVK